MGIIIRFSKKVKKIRWNMYLELKFVKHVKKYSKIIQNFQKCSFFKSVVQNMQLFNPSKVLLVF
jgi:hypothetical protein